MGMEGEAQRLMTRLRDISMAGITKGPGVSDPGAKGEAGHPS